MVNSPSQEKRRSRRGAVSRIESKCNELESCHARRGTTIHRLLPHYPISEWMTADEALDFQLRSPAGSRCIALSKLADVARKALSDLNHGNRRLAADRFFWVSIELSESARCEARSSAPPTTISHGGRTSPKMPAWRHSCGSDVGFRASPARFARGLVS
jgi:hypothetical protein